jgi:hypothetical protein
MMSEGNVVGLLGIYKGIFWEWILIWFQSISNENTFVESSADTDSNAYRCGKAIMCSELCCAAY